MSSKPDLQQAILSTTQSALTKLEEIEKEITGINFEEQVEKFNTLFGEIKTSTANELLKQVEKWSEGRISEHGAFEACSLAQYKDTLEFWRQNAEESRPYVQNEIEKMKISTAQHQSHLSVLKVMLSDIAQSPHQNDSIVSPSLQFNVPIKSKQATEAENERKRAKFREQLRVEEELLTKMRSYKMASEQLKNILEADQDLLASKVNEKLAIKQQLASLQAQMQSQQQLFENQRIKENEDYQKLKRELELNAQNQKEEEIRKQAIEKHQKEEEFKRRMAAIKFYHSTPITIEPYEVDIDSMKNKLNFLYNPDIKKSRQEVVYTKQSCLTEKGMPKNELISALLNFSANATSREQQIDQASPKVTSPLKKSVHFDQNQCPIHRVMSPRIPRLKPFSDFQQSERCLTPNIHENNVTYVFTEKYSNIEGEDKDYGSMKPLSISPCQSGFRVIFRDGNEGIIVDTKIKSSSKNIIVLTALSSPTRIKDLFV